MALYAFVLPVGRGRCLDTVERGDDVLFKGVGYLHRGRVRVRDCYLITAVFCRTELSLFFLCIFVVPRRAGNGEMRRRFFSDLLHDVHAWCESYGKFNRRA